MDALLMCGGQGKRLDADVEKPLFEVAERPMIDHVLGALVESEVENVYAVLSSNVPDTHAYLGDRPVTRIVAPGEGYVADMNHALAELSQPVLTVPADLPLLEGDAVDRVLDEHDSGPMAVYVPAALKRVLDVSLDLTVRREGTEAAPAGVNVVAESHGKAEVLTHDVRFAVNVNRRRDARIAEELL